MSESISISNVPEHPAFPLRAGVKHEKRQSKQKPAKAGGSEAEQDESAADEQAPTEAEPGTNGIGTQIDLEA